MLDSKYKTQYPYDISRFAFPLTGLQKKQIRTFTKFYPNDLECFTNHYHEKGRKVLLVVDDVVAFCMGNRGVEQNDIDRGCIFSGKEGQGLQNCLSYATGQADKFDDLKEITVFNWAAGEFDFKLNSNKSNDQSNKQLGYSVWYDRLLLFISKYKPDTVVIGGVEAWEYCYSRLKNDYASNKRSFMSRLLPVSIPIRSANFQLNLKAAKKQRHHFNIVGTVDVKPLVVWTAKATTHPNLIGFFNDCLITAINNRNRYTVRIPDDVRFVLIDTLEKFDKFYNKLTKQKIVSIDTETEGLGRVKNTIYTAQFCWDGIVGYVLPLDHPATPFSPEERQYLKDKLKHYFEYGKSLYHIYQNGKFDITVFYACLGIRFYNHRCYDIQAGVYSLDENIKLLGTLFSVKSDPKRWNKPYALDFVAERYGCSVYRQISFSKGNRGQISTEGLTPRFVEYAAYDVILPFIIHGKQIKEAKRRGYRKYLIWVCEQLSDTFIALAQMEHTGIPIDKKHLFKLKAKNGPVTQIRDGILEQYKSNKAAQKVNNYLVKKLNIPRGQGIFGETTWVFDVKKDQHKQLFFFKSLKLEPLGEKKLGGFKTDAKFLKTYADIPEVQMFSDFQKARTLNDNFIEPTFEKMKYDPDALFDGRIRSSYDIIRVSTGRLSSFGPNRQNIPQRGPYAKHIKRLDKAEKGFIFVKGDFSAHEVRDWANQSGDKGLQDSFYLGMRYRYELRALTYKYEKNLEEWFKIEIDTKWHGKDDKTKKPLHTYESKLEIIKLVQDKITKQIGLAVLELEAKGDLHRLNAKRFFSLESALDVSDDQRYEIKAVVFGVIYGKGKAGLAKPKAEGGLGRDEDYCQGLIDSLAQEFPTGWQWLEEGYQFGRDCLYVESPLGMQRHLPGYLHSRPAMQNAMNRRTGNSKIQGTASCMGVTSMRNLQKLLWHFFVKHGEKIAWKMIINDVHDAIESHVQLSFVPIYTYLAEHSATSMIHKRYRDVFGYELSIGLETEYGIGATMDRVSKWDFTHKSLLDTLRKEIEFQNSELGYDLHVDKEMAKIQHNWNIVRDLRLREIEASLETNERVSYSMLLNESNARKQGFILEAA